MTKKVKLSDIAKELGVSVPLVSFVLSDKWKENRVSEELAKKVKAKAESMGYQANTTARALRTGKTGVIGLVVADISNPFYGKFAREIENQASKLGLQLMFASSDEDLSKFIKAVDTLLSRQVDGLIVVPVEGSQEYLEGKSKQGVPIVLVDRKFENSNITYVVDDGFYGGKKLTNCLVENGYNRVSSIAFERDLSNLQDRLDGFSDSKLDKNANTQSIIKVPIKNYELYLEKQILKAISKGVNAFFFTQNRLGTSGLRILKKNNIRIPQDVAIVSYDNPDIFELLTPSITCYQQSISEICAISVSIITDMIKNVTIENRSIKIKGEFIERESSKSIK